MSPQPRLQEKTVMIIREEVVAKSKSDIFKAFEIRPVRYTEKGDLETGTLSEDDDFYAFTLYGVNQDNTIEAIYDGRTRMDCENMLVKLGYDNYYFVFWPE